MSLSAIRAWMGRLQWRRGVRALFAIGCALWVCRVVGVAPAAVALGAFNPLLVDNGGPYRTRLTTMATAVVAGAVMLIVGCVMPAALWAVVPATLVVCFVLTYARVVSQPVASTSVLILVLYFAGLGGVVHTWHGALISAGMVLVGGVWAIALSLVLWPVDPFRPARLGVAGCYRSMAEFTARLAGGMEEAAVYEWQRGQRARMEEARAALAATGARAPSRTVRARNLTVLLETADMLLARTMRLTELAEAGGEQAREFDRWLAGAEGQIAAALEARPADGGASFGVEGSHWLQWLAGARTETASTPKSMVTRHLSLEERDARLEMGIAFEAVRAIWTGSDRGQVQVAPDRGRARDWIVVDGGSADAVAANWTLSSANMRHALRLTVVGAVDVLAMRAIHVNHGFWLPMTSIILMQPFSAGTNRKSVQRVSGTIAGGILAALLAASLNSAWMLPVIAVLAGMTLATFAVDYAVYCFFLTPTFVLMSLPHPHDWRYAGIRIGTTLVGATIAVLAMRLLWPERAEQELGTLLRRGAAADAEYLRAMLRFWETPPAKRRAAEREVLAPARRACGMASNDAEEAVDRVMQEPSFGFKRSGKVAEEALTATTYLRRLTQSITTLAPLGRDTPAVHARLENLAGRLEVVAGSGPGVGGGRMRAVPVLVDFAEEQMQRIERQVEVLEKTMLANQT